MAECLCLRVFWCFLAMLMVVGYSEGIDGTSPEPSTQNFYLFPQPHQVPPPLHFTVPPPPPPPTPPLYGRPYKSPPPPPPPSLPPSPSSHPQPPIVHSSVASPPRQGFESHPIPPIPSHYVPAPAPSPSVSPSLLHFSPHHNSPLRFNLVLELGRQS